MQISGGLNRYSEAADLHAERMYKEISKRMYDYLDIAKNTDFSIEQVQMVKSYIFKHKHYLDGKILTEKFHPTYEIAESWKRLSEKGGKNIKKHDVLLLYHELYEINLLLVHTDMSQNTAHNLANVKYNYEFACREFYRN